MGALMRSAFVLAAILCLGVDARAQAPFPGAGQTVHWTTAMSPITLSSNQTIVWTGTVIVDPGVTVRMTGNAALTVNGRLESSAGSTLRATYPAQFVVGLNGSMRVAGAPGNPAYLRGGGAFLTQSVSVQPYGVLELDEVDSDVIVYGARNSLVLVEDSTFRLSGLQYDYAGLNCQLGTLAVRRSRFLGARIEANQAYLLVDDLVVDGGLLDLDRYRAGQPLWIDRVDARNHATDSPFLLRGFDYAFGPSNVILNNVYPVHLVGGGIAPGSVLPATGNVNDYVHGGIGEIVGDATFADAGLDYRIDFDPSFPEIHSKLRIEPGVTVRLGFEAYLWATIGGVLDARGLPGAPITFTRLDPSMPWKTVNYGVNNTRPHLEHVVIEGSELGLIADETNVRIDESLIRDNAVGAFASNSARLIARKTRFESNDVGVRTSPGSPGSGFGYGTADLNGATNPNSFTGNAVALQVQNFNANPDARENWWGAASGPQHTSNPGGGGDPVSGTARVIPFRTSAPDSSDASPIVRMPPHSFLMEAGQRVILTWTATDDRAIAAQRITYWPHGDLAATQHVADVDPSRRSHEIVIPQPPPSSSIAASVLRVTAIDDAGQESYDEIRFFTPLLDFQSGVVAHPINGPLTPGQNFTICWTNLPNTSGTVDFQLFLDGDAQSYSLGGRSTTVTCLPSSWAEAPPVSTDLARVGIRFNQGAGGRSRWSFTPYFSIRPDARVGDAPPVVAMTSPPSGASFVGGSIVPIAWTASDDESLRSFAVHASYDAGRTWNVIASDLPAADRNHLWRLPASSGIPDVRVRVVATDLRYQNGSSGADRALSILAGDATGSAYCFGDGGGLACPCANSGALGNGCANSVNSTGANLSATGVASIAADSLVLHGTGMTNSSVLYFQGTSTANVAFGDGIRCAGGGVVRLGTRQNVGGASRLPDPGGPALHTTGLVALPGTRYYQAWYRNAGAYCTPSTFNLSNGLEIAWGS